MAIANGTCVSFCNQPKGPFRPSASTRVEASNQTNVKDRKHSHRARRRALTNLHKSNERCQLYIGYWTSNNNKMATIVRVAIRLHHQITPEHLHEHLRQCNNVTENDVIDSWMNMHTLLASRTCSV